MEPSEQKPNCGSCSETPSGCSWRVWTRRARERWGWQIEASSNSISGEHFYEDTNQTAFFHLSSSIKAASQLKWQMMEDKREPSMLGKKRYMSGYGWSDEAQKVIKWDTRSHSAEGLTFTVDVAFIRTHHVWFFNSLKTKTILKKYSLKVCCKSVTTVSLYKGRFSSVTIKRSSFTVNTSLIHIRILTRFSHSFLSECSKWLKNPQRAQTSTQSERPFS